MASHKLDIIQFSHEAGIREVGEMEGLRPKRRTLKYEVTATEHPFYETLQYLQFDYARDAPKVVLSIFQSE